MARGGGVAHARRASKGGSGGGGSCARCVEAAFHGGAATSERETTVEGRHVCSGRGRRKKGEVGVVLKIYKSLGG